MSSSPVAETVDDLCVGGGCLVDGRLGVGDGDGDVGDRDRDVLGVGGVAPSVAWTVSV